MQLIDPLTPPTYWKVKHFALSQVQMKKIEAQDQDSLVEMVVEKVLDRLLDWGLPVTPPKE